MNGAGWWHRLSARYEHGSVRELVDQALWTPVPIVRLVRWEQSRSWAGGVTLVDRGGDVDLDQAVRHPHRVNDRS